MILNDDYAVIDVETTEIEDGKIPKTKFWGYADANGYECFKNTEKLLDFLEDSPPKVLLHHTNFDIIQMLIDGADVKILKSHDQRLIKCKIGEHILQNSYSSFPVKLASIMEAYGYKKTSLKNLAKRNYEDCVNGLKCLLNLDSAFQSLCFVSPLHRGTIAGTGFAAAEKFAGKMPKDLRFIDAYRGGRVEVFDLRYFGQSAFVYRNKFLPHYQKTDFNKQQFPFKRIDKNVNRFDINSSYPQSFMEAQTGEELWHVRVRTKDFHCPLFDEIRKDTLLFPNGEFKSYVFKSVWEKYIEPYAEKTSIKILSRHKIDFSWIVRLKEMVQTIYAKKLESKGGVKLACKLLLNALYGRIGLRGESERARILEYVPDGDDIAVYFLGNNRFLCFDKVERETRSNFAFAAFITDNARGRLFRAFKSNVPIYGDTDSIITCDSINGFKQNLGVSCGEWSHDPAKDYGAFNARNVKDYWFYTPETLESGKFETRKGGTKKTVWTMKLYASGETAHEVIRERKTPLRKRFVNSDGTTEPLIVGK